MQNYIEAGSLSLTFAIPDHPWTKAGPNAAAVRIAMSVAQRGMHDGRLVEIVSESKTETDVPELIEDETFGRLHSDFSTGADSTSAKALKANEGMSCNGVMLGGQGFKISKSERDQYASIEANNIDIIVKRYFGGAEIVQNPRNRFVIDFFGYSERAAREKYPKLYQHIYLTVKPERDRNRMKSRRENWWLFGGQGAGMRPMTDGLPRYIGTTETTKHRLFQFLPGDSRADHMIIVIGSDEAYHLGLLSSNVHLQWTFANCGLMGVASFEQGHRYTKSQIFDTFPFPSASLGQRATIADLAEELDATRKAALADVPGLTMTEIYNLRDKLRSGEPINSADQQRASAARAGIVNRLHEQIDEAVAAAYGWPADLSPSEIVTRLVALNAERAAEEANGRIRWLRPEYQEPRFGKKK